MALLLDNQELDRYSRFLLLSDITQDHQLSIKSTTVVVVGAGGLGCVALPYIVGFGFGSVVIIDHDSVSLSNLSRQTLYSEKDIGAKKCQVAAKRLQIMNKKVKVCAIDLKIEKIKDILSVVTPLLSSGSEKKVILVDCSDNYSTRSIINYASVNLKLPLVSAAAIGYKAQVYSFSPTYGGCYLCLYPNVTTQKDTCSTSGVFSPVLGVAASIMVQEIVNVADAVDKNSSSSSKIITFDMKSMAIKSATIEKDRACECCGKFKN